MEFGAETALWPMPAAKKAGRLYGGVLEAADMAAAKKASRWYRGVLEAAERSMASWYENEAQLGRKRHCICRCVLSKSDGS